MGTCGVSFTSDDDNTFRSAPIFIGRTNRDVDVARFDGIAHGMRRWLVCSSLFILDKLVDNRYLDRLDGECFCTVRLTSDEHLPIFKLS